MRLNTDKIEELIYSAVTTVYLQQRVACHCFFSDVDCVHLNSGVPNTMVQLEFVYATSVCVGFFWVLRFDLTIQNIQHRRVVQEVSLTKCTGPLAGQRSCSLLKCREQISLYIMHYGTIKVLFSSKRFFFLTEGLFQNLIC